MASSRPSTNTCLIRRRSSNRSPSVTALERADTVGRAGDLRGVDRERADGRIGRQPFAHGAAGIAHEVRRIAQPGRRKGERHAGLVERCRNLRCVRTRFERSERLVRVRRQGARPDGEIEVVDHPHVAGLEFGRAFVRLPGAGHDRIQLGLLAASCAAAPTPAHLPAAPHGRATGATVPFTSSARLFRCSGAPGGTGAHRSRARAGKCGRRRAAGDRQPARWRAFPSQAQAGAARPTGARG